MDLERNNEVRDINRIKVVLVEHKRTNKWLAEQLGKDPATISKFVTNRVQPNLETLVQIAKCLMLTSANSYIRQSVNRIVKNVEAVKSSSIGNNKIVRIVPIYMFLSDSVV